MIDKMIDCLTEKGSIRIHGSKMNFIEIFPEEGVYGGKYRLIDSLNIGYNSEVEAVENAVLQLGGIEKVLCFGPAVY